LVQTAEIGNLQLVAWGDRCVLFVVGHLEGEGASACEEIAFHRDGPVIHEQAEHQQPAAVEGGRGNGAEVIAVRGLDGHRRALAAFPAAGFEIQEGGNPAFHLVARRERAILDPTQFAKAPFLSPQFPALPGRKSRLQIGFRITARPVQSSGVALR
jgi:hypothetical protein